MEWVETTGRTVEEAVDAALDELGVDEDEVEFEILEEPRGGLLGRLRSQARVRARVRPTAPRQKEDRRDRRRRARERQNAPQGVVPGGDRTGRGEVTEVVTDDVSPKGEVQVDDEVSLGEQGEMAREFVAGLVEAFEFDADVTVREIDEETVEVAVNGQDLGLLIGPRGQTLGSIQELARTVVQHQVPGWHARVLVDVSGYREKRRVALERFAQQVASEVVASGQRRALEPMSPADRKVVHDTVNVLEGVSTVSEGEEPNRRVVIVPEDRSA